MVVGPVLKEGSSLPVLCEEEWPLRPWASTHWALAIRLPH